MASRDRIERYKTTGEAAGLDRLFDEAVTRYGKRCLWNVNPQPTPGGMHIIADKLRKHGDMEAWELATRIRKAINDAT